MDNIQAHVRTIVPGSIQCICTDNLIIYNVYGPAGSQSQEYRKQFYNQLLGYINVESRTPIMLGDWNCIINKEDAETNYKRKLSPELKTIINLKQYHDCYQRINQRNDYTFNRQYMGGSRLDRVYLPEQEITQLIDCKHIPTLSDHKAVITTLRTPNTVQPQVQHQTSPYWKLNTKVLTHPQFKDIFQEFWNKNTEARNENESWADWWENTLKPKLTQLLQELSKERSQTRKTTRYHLYRSLDKAIHNKQWEIVHGLQDKLKLMMMDDMDGLIIRSGDREIIDEEKGSIYHLSREMKRAQTGNLNKLIINEQETTNTDEIEEEVTSFYKALYNGQHRSSENDPVPRDTGQPFQQDRTHLDEFLEHLPEIDINIKNKLEEPIKCEELVEAIKSSSNNKSPGLDGIPHELYKETIDVIGPILTKVFQEQLDRNELIASGKEGVTRLIPKTKDTPSIQQLRPITLLNCDYKLMSKVLATRLNKALPDILTSSQLCTRHNRNILSGATDILACIEYAKEKETPGYLLSLDAYKAFDKANIQFITQVMTKMGFGDTFTSWIRTMHKDVGTRIIIKNKLSSRIDIPLSLRQGDNIAMPLFIIKMEPLLLNLNRNLKGTNIGLQPVKDSAYVDDMQIVSRHLEDITTADNICRKFEGVCGMVLSRQKTQIMGFGTLKNNNEWPIPWAQTKQEIKAYGITFKPSIKETVKASWSKCTETVRKCIHTWQSRTINTLSQRTFIAQTYALSKLWYLGQVLPINEKNVLEIERECRRFLWKGRLEHLPWEELVTEREEGGLGFPSIREKCDSLFLRHLHKSLQDEKSRKIMGYWIGINVRKEFPDLLTRLSSETVPEYYKHVASLLKEGSKYQIIPGTKTKKIYQTLTSIPPTPKIQYNKDLPWNMVYKRTWNKHLQTEQQDLMFSIINNIYPTKQRLQRLNQHPDGKCRKCNKNEDTYHAFLTCQNVTQLWQYIKQEYPRLMNERNTTQWIDLSYNYNNNITKLLLIATVIQLIHRSRINQELPTIEELKNKLTQI